MNGISLRTIIPKAQLLEMLKPITDTKISKSWGSINIPSISLVPCQSMCSSKTTEVYIAFIPNTITFACLKLGRNNSSRCNNRTQFMVSWKWQVLLAVWLTIFFQNFCKRVAPFASCPAYKTMTEIHTMTEISGRKLYMFVQYQGHCTSSWSHFLYLEDLPLTETPDWE